MRRIKVQIIHREVISVMRNEIRLIKSSVKLDCLIISENIFHFNIMAIKSVKINLLLI